jgi:hypothetical protein
MSARMIVWYEDGVSGFGDHVRAQREDGPDGKIAAPFRFVGQVDGATQMSYLRRRKFFGWCGN